MNDNEHEDMLGDDAYLTLTDLVAERQVTARRVRALDAEIQRIIATHDAAAD